MLLDLATLLMKLALFVGPIVLMHVATTARVVRIWGRKDLLIGAMFAFGVSLVAFWVSGWGVFEMPITNPSAFDVIFRISDFGIAALGFAIGVVFQVIRFRKPGPSLRAKDAFNQPLAASHAPHAAKRPSARKY